MTIRNTETEKWNDPWFRRLSPASKLVFLYLCDRCDIAGFWEIDTELAEFHIGYDQNIIKGALKGLGEKIEKNQQYIWLRNFIRRQRNLPLNTANNAHRGIVKRLQEHRGLCDEIDRLLSSEGLASPSGGALEPPCKGKGKNKGKGKGGESVREGGYPAKSGKRLAGKVLQHFEEFWEAFDYKRGKAEAADAWLQIKGIDDVLFDAILDGARREATNRPGLLRVQRTPKMAQGWLSSRRWEDEPEKFGPERGARGRDVSAYEKVVQRGG